LCSKLELRFSLTLAIFLIAYIILLQLVLNISWYSVMSHYSKYSFLNKLSNVIKLNTYVDSSMFNFFFRKFLATRKTSFNGHLFVKPNTHVNAVKSTATYIIVSMQKFVFIQCSFTGDDCKDDEIKYEINSIN